MLRPAGLTPVGVGRYLVGSLNCCLSCCYIPLSVIRIEDHDSSLSRCSCAFRIETSSLYTQELPL